MSDIKIKDLLNQINNDLKSIVNKPVIHIESGKYDEINGRRIISSDDICKMLNKHIDKSYFFKWRNKIILDNTQLIFRVVRMESKMDLQKPTTIVALELMNNDFLEKTINQIYEEAIKNEELIQKQYLECKEKEKNEVMDILKSYNMSFKEFEHLLSLYECLNWDFKREIRKIMNKVD